MSLPTQASGNAFRPVQSPNVPDREPPTKPPRPTAKTPAAKGLRNLGLVFLGVSAIPMLLAATLVWGRFDANVTEASQWAVAILFPVSVVSVLLVLGGSIAEFVSSRSWPSAGGASAKYLGLFLMGIGVVALVVGLILGQVGDRSDDASLQEAGKRVAGMGLVETLAGTALTGVGAWIGNRTGSRPMAGLDGALAVAAIAVAFLFTNPGALGVDADVRAQLSEAGKAFEANPGAKGSTPAPGKDGAVEAATDLVRPLRVLSFNGTLSASVRDPLLGAGQNAPGSTHVFEFSVTDANETSIVLELDWDESGTDHLRLLLEVYQNGEWVQVADPTQAAPLLEVSNLPQTGDYRTRVFVGDGGDAAVDLDFHEKLSLFDRVPPEDYRVFPK